MEGDEGIYETSLYFPLTFSITALKNEVYYNYFKKIEFGIDFFSTVGDKWMYEEWVCG